MRIRNFNIRNMEQNTKAGNLQPDKSTRHAQNNGYDIRTEQNVQTSLIRLESDREFIIISALKLFFFSG
jgi:hypothetical protein